MTWWTHYTVLVGLAIPSWGVGGATLCDLMISVNYEIHAPVDTRGLNYKIPRIYFKPSYM
jgi:hypothetical protein